MKPLLEDRLRCFQPDVVLGHLWDAQTVPLLEHAAQRGFPSFFSVQRVEEILDGFRFPENIHVIAHSPFTASLAAVKTSQKVGLILHSIEQNRYRVKKRKRKYITFINPIPEKGLAIAAEAARRLPDERFLFVEGGWGNGLAECRQAVRGLSNVEIWSHQTDMRRVYGITDILLIPSQYDETFGRVILEAQMNGIPVVAAARGAIPHTLGKGGCLIRLPHQAAGYVAAIRRLRSSPAFYQKRSAWARANSRRLEFKPSVQAENFVRFVKQSMAESR